MRPERTEIKLSSLIKMGIPRNLADKTLNDFIAEDSDEKEVKQFIKDYLKDLNHQFKLGMGLFLCGSNGVGKTMLACIILKEAYKKRYSARRITFSRYLSLLSESWDGGEDSFELFKTAEFLALEEIGKEVESKLSAPTLEELIRYRDENMLPTLICTNLSIEAVEKKYGASVTSLIKGNTYPIQIVSKDRRYS